jgi:nickel-dependent lactate racemase
MPSAIQQDYISCGSANTVIDLNEADRLLDGMLARIGPLRRVLLVPPDYTRIHSWSGELTCMLYQKLAGNTQMEIMPALGTHSPMTETQRERMFPGIPGRCFRDHDWRNNLVRLGEVPCGFIHEISGGVLDYPVYCEINRLLIEGDWDRIISIGQVVPHEVAGIANHAKNIFIGAGGADTIHKTHFLGAVFGMERIMGRSDTCVRKVFEYMRENIAPDLPVTYLLTVRDQDESNDLVTRGLYAGNDRNCFDSASELSREINIHKLDHPLKNVVVYLDSDEFHSTWLGNKAVYRTRMALADEAELVILAPGVDRFGEDPQIERLIRRHGYRGTEHVLSAVKQDPELASNLSAAAHLIHGSSEGRFRITFCPGGLSRGEIEDAGYSYGDLDEMLKRYPPDHLQDGFNSTDEHDHFYYISNPGLGLWGLKDAFDRDT